MSVDITGAASAAVARLFERLVDDAAIFPPGNAPLPEAVPAHERHRRAWYAGLVGPFLCAAGRLDELRAVLERRGAQAPPLDVALVVTGVEAARPAIGAMVSGGHARLAGVELAPAYGGDAPAVAREAVATLAEAVPPGVQATLEVPRGQACEGVLDVLAAEAAGAGAGPPVRAKLRTGGLEAAAFPSEDEVAAFVEGCARRGLAFKCTAGLHHALRHTEAGTGFEQHGYLNILLAAGAAATGSAAPDLAGVLAERDPRVVVEEVGRLDEPAAARARGLFTAFGACSIAEPLADAVALGLLRPPAAAAPAR